ncbi:MAG: hypothetical protein ACIPMY_06245 [Rickettsia endosymbiont of Pentastiridius leporinus]
MLCQPIDQEYNLLQINIKYLNRVSIDGFFVGYDYNIVVDLNTGRISLVQSMDRALTSGKIIASMDNSTFQNYLNIRAGQGLCFHGNPHVIEGNIELYTLFGILSVRGSLKAGNQIKLLAIHGNLDLSAELNAHSIITYSGTQAFIADTIINANEFLSQVVGHYFQKDINITASKATIISESSNIMLEASTIHAAILQAKASRDIILNQSNIHASTNQVYDGENIYFINNNISGYESSFNAYKNILGIKSNFSSSRTNIRAGYDSLILESNFVGNEIFNSAGSETIIRNSQFSGTTLANQTANVNISNSHISSNRIVTKAENHSTLIESNFTGNEILNLAGGDTIIRNSQLTGTTLVNQGTSVNIVDSRLSGTSITVRAEHTTTIKNSSLSGGEVQNYGGKNVVIDNSQLRSNTVINQSEDINITNTNVTGSRIINQAENDLRIVDSKVIGNQIENYAGRDININRSNIAGNLQVNYAQGNININNSNLLAANIIGDAKGNITVDSSQILSEDNIFFRAVSHYFAVNSNIYLGQFSTTLFLHNSGAVDNNNNPLVRCGFEVRELEILGILNKKGFAHSSFDQFQYHLVNSSNIELGIFQYIASENPKGIIIDANTGVIMGSSLSAKDHNVIIRTKNGMELLPLNLYNAAIFSGGFNNSGISTVISKIAAGLIDIDGGTYIKSVGALLRANTGNLKADYIYNESFIATYSARNANLHALKPWLTRPELYDMIVNNNVVSTRLEFSEVTKIDLGKGKIDLYYPYMSKQVYLRQREGDVVINRDSHFAYEVMAVQADQGKIFFGIPRVEQLIFNFFGRKHLIAENHTTEHVNVTGNNLRFSAGDDIDLHGNISVTGTVQLQSTGGNVKVHTDKHNFGSTVKQSVINANNAYLVGENIEIIGGLIKVKNHFKIFSHNDVKIIPIELIHRYTMQDSKTSIAEMRIKQIVSEINAGILDIEAGRAVEFIGALIQAEELNLKAKELNIKSAKEIFEKQLEFKGKKKWHGKRNCWSEYDYIEEIVPTIIEVGKLRMLVDNNATIEASQIFVSNEVLTKVGGNLTIKDGYNIHIHDYHAKKYSLCSFNKGNMKINTTKNIYNFYERGEAIPTLVCAGGIFYGVVEGRMHVLGSTIMGPLKDNF